MSRFHIPVLDPKAPAYRLRRGIQPRALRVDSPEDSQPQTRSTLVTPGTLVLFCAAAAIGSFAAARVPQFERFIDHIQAFSRAHTEILGSGFNHWLPVTLVVGSCTILAILGFFALRDWRPRAGHVQTTAETALQAAVASLPKVSRNREKQPDFEPEVFTAADELAGPSAAPEDRAAMEKFGYATRYSNRAEEADMLKIRHDAIATNNARADAAGPVVERHPVVFPTSDLDSLPTLPVAPRVRRKNPHGPLPPAVAAALRAEAAAVISTPR